MPSSVSRLSRAQRVWPVSAELSLGVAPMSPQARSGAAVCSLPRTTNTCPMRSAWAVFAFQSWPSLLNVPLYTRKYDSLPTNGSAAVLNMSAARGPSLSASRDTSPPPSGLAALTAPASAGDGRKSTMASSISVVPISAVDAPASTGMISPSAMPCFRPPMSSAWVSSSPSRYLVARSSSASATASMRRSRASSASSARSAGMSALGSSRLTTPEKSASAPMGS